MLTYRITVPANSINEVFLNDEYEGSWNVTVQTTAAQTVYLSNDGVELGFRLGSQQGTIPGAGLGLTDYRAKMSFVTQDEQVYLINTGSTDITVDVLMYPTPSTKVNLCVSSCEGN